MKNPLTIKVESYLGSFFVLSTAIFFGSMIYISAKNLDSEIIVMESQRVHIKTISPTEKAIIDEWVKQNHVSIPEGKGYRYITLKYPSKPWFD